ncbi:preprotein translocase subunit YajC [Corynebacterium sp. CNCTC7651]|nr:preprotein translocase subunit YajC [Corynebacterium sp. CNCTC7651]UIZ91350.1 preprotein translocase subunit YajC [Corynebacterium sp. CNCTC7651]
MEFLPLLIILLLFLVPPMLLMRTQRKRQGEVQAMRDGLQPGDKIITVAGLHGTVVGKRGEVVDLDIAPGTVVQLEIAGVMRTVDPVSEIPVEGETPAP